MTRTQICGHVLFLLVGIYGIKVLIGTAPAPSGLLALIGTLMGLMLGSSDKDSR